MDKKRVLLVEDEQIIAFDIRLTLQAAGYEVIKIVSNAEDAIELALQEKPDLILMDIQLDGNSSGIDAAEKILARYAVPILFQSGNEDVYLRNNISSNLLCDIITKPIPDKKLIEKINSMVS